MVKKAAKWLYHQGLKLFAVRSICHFLAYESVIFECAVFMRAGSVHLARTQVWLLALFARKVLFRVLIRVPGDSTFGPFCVAFCSL